MGAVLVLPDAYDNNIWKAAGIMVDADVLFPCAATRSVFTSLPFRDTWTSLYLAGECELYNRITISKTRSTPGTIFLVCNC